MAEHTVRFRLTGALVLVLVAVLVFPWLLDGAGYDAMQELVDPIPERPLFFAPEFPDSTARPPLPMQDLLSDTHSEGSGAGLSAGLAEGLPDHSGAGYGAGLAAAQMVVSPAERTATVAPSVTPPPARSTLPQSSGSESRPAAGVTPVREPAATPAATSGAGWVVQVGSFGREANAREKMQRLRNAGYAAFIEQTQADGRAFWRVKIGPENQRDQALTLRDRVQREFNFTSAIVVAHP